MIKIVQPETNEEALEREAKAACQRIETFEQEEDRIGFTTIPLSQAVLCVNCEAISYTQARGCPRCGRDGTGRIHLGRFFSEKRGSGISRSLEAINEFVRRRGSELDPELRDLLQSFQLG